MESPYDYITKVVLIGESAVGKTNLLTRYCKDEFKTDSKTTVGIEFAFKNEEHNGKKIKLQIWDTAGQEKFKSITNSFYNHTNAAMVVFDIAKFSSFEKVNNWVSELKQNAGDEVEILLVGNKSDLKEFRAVTFEDAEEKANVLGIDYIETSALMNTNVKEAFDILIQKMIKRLGVKEEEEKKEKNLSFALNEINSEPPQRNAKVGGCCE